MTEAAGRLGPQGLTVQAVADALGVTRAAIYHYVSDVEELRRIAAYARMSGFATLADEDRSWQDWLRDFAHATRAWRLAHGEPYVQLTLGLPETQAFVVIVDRAIRLLVDAGFTERRARHAFQYLAGVVWINAQDELNARTTPTTWWGDPTDRFTRELDWTILALEHDLED